MKKIIFITLAILAVAVVAVISKGKLQDKGNLMDNTNTYTVIAPNGDKIEFNFVNDKRIGEAEKFYKNGDRELFIYGENNQKNGNSVYYFANGDVEETTYVNGILQGPAKYIYKDGVVEQYKYKNGKRIEN